MIAKEVPKLEKPFHVLFFRLWLHWVHTEGRLTTIVQRFPSEQIGTDLFSTAEDCRLTSHCKWPYYYSRAYESVFPQATALFSQRQHQLVSCFVWIHTLTQNNSSFASLNRSNIFLYFVCTGFYQGIPLCSILFFYKIDLGKANKLCFLIDYGCK